MRDLAYLLLKRSGIAFNGADVTLLASDLASVEYEERLDKYITPRAVENIFLHRLGGIGNLGKYLPCIRRKP